MIGLAPEGARIVLGIFLLGIVTAGFGLFALSVLLVLLSVAVGAFFRDPERYPERTQGVCVSGADGKVTDVSECALPDDRETVYHRVSVFMSPLNVHVNRAPIAGDVVTVEHTPGDFRAAFRDDANEGNERNLLVFRDQAGRRYGMLQVAGYFARRIVCRVRAHDRIEMGQRIGLIMFGSRVDHFIPPGYRVTVAPGEHVRAGESVIGELSAGELSHHGT